MKKATYHILYIEDDEVDILYMKRLLIDKKNLFVLEVAQSFREAINLLSEKDIDIIVTDNQLSDGTLLDFNDKLGSVPFLITSGLDSKELDRISKLSGASGFIAKPADKDQLIKKIQEILSLDDDSAEKNDEEKFNIKGLEAISGGDDTFAREMIEVLQSKFPNDINELKKAVISSDWPAAEKIAHNLKSSFKIFGGDELGKVCSEIESISRGKNITSDIQDKINKLEQKGNIFLNKLSELVQEK